MLTLYAALVKPLLLIILIAMSSFGSGKIKEELQE